MTGALTLQNDLIIETANGLDVNPGADGDVDLITVGVTTTPRIWWDESEDAVVHNNINFIDVSSFNVNGSVVYRNTNYGVKGVNILIDGMRKMSGAHALYLNHNFKLKQIL